LVESAAAPDRLPTLASTLASGSFTLLGFLTAVLAIFVTLKESRALRQFKQRGHLRTTQIFIVSTIVVLAITFCLSMSLFFGAVSFWRLQWTIVACAASVGMTAVCMTPFVSLQHKSS
jgi:ABC-type spermidine/putrescine transport system permease subunit II